MGVDAGIGPTLGGGNLRPRALLAFGIYEMRIGRASNSPSLIADAREFQAHVLSSGLVFERAHQISEEISEPIGSHPERRYLAASARRGRPPRPEVTLDERFRSDPAPAACTACRGREGARTPVTETRSSARMPPRKP